MSTGILDRVKIRKPDSDPDVLQELITTVTDRIKLRVGTTDDIPEQLNSIAVEVVCAMVNQQRYEGIKSEGIDTFSVSFVDDLLKTYEADIAAYLNSEEKSKSENYGRFRFL